MKNFARGIACFVVLGVVIGIAACTPGATETAAPADTRAVDEATIRATIERWAAASQAKDAEAFAAVYAPDAVVMFEGAANLNGEEAIRAGVGAMMQDPNFGLSFTPDEVVVARAGDLAYEAGTFSLNISDAEGEPASEQGHYLVVWRKEADGTWKVIYDVPVSDPAPPEAAAGS